MKKITQFINQIAQRLFPRKELTYRRIPVTERFPKRKNIWCEVYLKNGLTRVGSAFWDGERFLYQTGWMERPGQEPRPLWVGLDVELWWSSDRRAH